LGRIVGIDLGTSTSEIACIIDGAPVVIPNTIGRLITPSVVHIGDDGETLVGEPAAEYLFTRPDCTFMEVKRMTGGGKTVNVRGKEYSPEDLQSILIRYLCGCAAEYLGEPVERAVITVPAYFTDVQRRLTARAGELAGLTVERIINEPTAAAMDYGLSNLSESRNILVFDFGGGTLDVTVLELFSGVIDVKASCGNNKLGGKDFDEIIMGKLADVSGDDRALMRIKKAAEDCKIALSSVEEYNISLPFLSTGAYGKPVSVEKTVTRNEFDEWVRDKVESARAPILTALSDSGLSASDLDMVLLVGGSTRIPCIRRFVADELSTVPQSHVDPDLTVVRGAAIQAGIIEGVFTDGYELILTDVCPYTLGIAVVDNDFYDKRQIFDPIIQRNTTIPVDVKKIYGTHHDNQTEADIEVYQGDSINLEYDEYLGKIRLSGIPAARRGKETVEVTLSYDMNGILQVTCKSVSSGKQVNAEIKTAGIQPLPTVDLAKWESAEGAKRFRPAIRRAEKIIAADEDDTGDIDKLTRSIKEALIRGDMQKAEEQRDILIEIMEALRQ